jgi:hypothetical protein
MKPIPRCETLPADRDWWNQCPSSSDLPTPASLSHGWVGARRDPRRQAVSMGSFPINLFSQVCIALWGRDNAAWAQELGIAERTIRRYENGDMEPPEGVWRELLIRVQRVRDTWAYDQTEEDRWTKIADQIKARRTLLWHNVHMPDENILTLRDADQARTDFALIENHLEFIAGQLARVPTRGDLAKAALGIIFCSAVFTALFVWIVWH